MYFEKWEIIEEPENNGPMLLRHRERRDKGTVVHLSRSNGQLQSAMPGDFPRGGGAWFAGISDSGVNYVAGLYSYGYARKKYNELMDVWD